MDMESGINPFVKLSHNQNNPTGLGYNLGAQYYLNQDLTHLNNIEGALWNKFKLGNNQTLITYASLNYNYIPNELIDNPNSITVGANYSSKMFNFGLSYSPNILPDSTTGFRVNTNINLSPNWRVGLGFADLNTGQSFSASTTLNLGQTTNIGLNYTQSTDSNNISSDGVYGQFQMKF